MKFLRILLFPFALLFRTITGIRNHLFNIGYKKSIQFDVPVLGVGNLIAGGSGKTPMIEYLIQRFMEEYQIATLSRGYGRRTRGFRLASENDSSSTIGDEPFQFYKKYGSKIIIAVGEERALAIPEILFNRPEVNLILLDDAFQHRYVHPALNILLTEYWRPFFTDHVLPMGLLRESRSGARRADVIVVTKCPSDLNLKEINRFKMAIYKIAPGIPVFFTAIEYGIPKPEIGNLRNRNVIALSGIGNPEPFEAYIGGHYQLKEAVRYPDHHHFTKNDVRKIIDKAMKYGEDTIVLTTEKDYGRLMEHMDEFRDHKINLCYLPIRFRFLFDEKVFDGIISDAIIANERKEKQ